MKGLRLIRLLFVVAVALVTLLAVAATLLVTLEFSPYRGPLEARLSHALGRQVRLAGSIRLRPSLYPTVTVRDVAVANPRWATTAYLAQAERLTTQFDLPALLQGRIEINRVALAGATVHLETHADGRWNWVGGVAVPATGAERGEASPMRLPRIEVRDSRVDFLDGRSGVLTSLDITKAELVADAGEPLELAFVGALRGREVSVGISGGPLADLLRREAPWPVRVAVASGSAVLTAAGELRRLPEPRFDLSVHASGADFRHLDALAGVRLPPLGPFELDAHLVRDGTGYRVDGVTGHLGPQGSDLRFSVEDGRLEAPVEGRTKIAVGGTFRGLPFDVNLDGAPYPRLLRDGERWPLRATLHVARTELTLDGTISPATQGFAVQVSAQGAHLDSLEPLVGRDLPRVGPYRIAGRLSRTGEEVALEDFVARVGESDARGSLRLRLGGARPSLTGSLRAKRLNLDDFRRAFPRAGSGRTASTAAAAVPRLHERLLPVGYLASIDARLEVEVGEVLGADTSIEALSFGVRLENGDLTADPVQVRLAGEALEGRIELRTEGTEPVGTLEARGQDIDYGPVLTALHLGERFSGRAEALAFSLEGRGRTLADIWRGAALRLTARRGTLVHTDPATGRQVRVQVEEGLATTGGGEGLVLNARGRYAGAPYTVRLSGDGLRELRDDLLRWQVEAEGTFAGVALGVAGTVREMFELRGMDLRVRGEGDRLDALGPLFSAELPALGPFRFAARLQDSLNGLRLSEVAARVGESDVAGQVRYTAFKERKRIVAELTSRSVRLADLRPQAVAASEAAPAAPLPQAEAGKVIPDLQLPVALLRALDLELAYTAGEVNLERTAWRDVKLEAVLQQGRLSVEPLSMHLWNGDVSGRMTVDAGLDEPTAAVYVTVTGLNYTQAFHSLGTVGISEGTADFAADLQGRGEGLRELLASGQGEVEFFGGSGRIENRYLDLWASDLLLAMVPTFSKDKAAELRCAVGHFDVAGGRASTRSLLLDVERVVIKGNGTLDLRTEALDFLLWPEPRNASLVSLSSPVRLTGTLGQPDISLQARGVLEDLAWLFFSATNPMALLVGLVKPSAVEDNPCLAAFAGENGKRRAEEHEPPNLLNKTGDFFRGLGNLLSKPFRDN